MEQLSINGRVEISTGVVSLGRGLKMILLANKSVFIQKILFLALVTFSLGVTLAI